jgi:hypothetical protein
MCESPGLRLRLGRGRDRALDSVSIKTVAVRLSILTWPRRFAVAVGIALLVGACGASGGATIPVKRREKLDARPVAADRACNGVVRHCARVGHPLLDARDVSVALASKGRYCRPR